MSKHWHLHPSVPEWPGPWSHHLGWEPAELSTRLATSQRWCRCDGRSGRVHHACHCQAAHPFHKLPLARETPVPWWLAVVAASGCASVRSDPSLERDELCIATYIGLRTYRESADRCSLRQPSHVPALLPPSFSRTSPTLLPPPRRRITPARGQRLLPAPIRGDARRALGLGSSLFETASCPRSCRQLRIPRASWQCTMQRSTGADTGTGLLPFSLALDLLEAARGCRRRQIRVDGHRQVSASMGVPCSATPSRRLPPRDDCPPSCPLQHSPPCCHTSFALSFHEAAPCLLSLSAALTLGMFPLSLVHSPVSFHLVSPPARRRRTGHLNSLSSVTIDF